MGILISGSCSRFSIVSHKLMSSLTRKYSLLTISKLRRYVKSLLLYIYIIYTYNIYTIYAIYIIYIQYSEVYLKCETSKMELFMKIVNDFKLLNIFSKGFIVDG